MYGLWESGQGTYMTNSRDCYYKIFVMSWSWALFRHTPFSRSNLPPMLFIRSLHLSFAPICCLCTSTPCANYIYHPHDFTRDTIPSVPALVIVFWISSSSSLHILWFFTSGRGYRLVPFHRRCSFMRSLLFIVVISLLQFHRIVELLKNSL